ncbi:MAG: adenylate/guanylate cyclase domain-containing protein [Coleofasciculus chthonoplastes F3-SA18-01]|uniref:adenylate/guanylate cyclase domain-containing protein n=1 Tax=Coleofasciculus chthonoplastes TaxID=64178 RepID=UPI0032FD5796
MLLPTFTRQLVKGAKCSQKMPLRVVLVVPFLLQIFAAVGLTGYLSFRNGQQAVDNLVTQLQTEVSDRIVQHVDSYLETPHLVNHVLVNAVRRRQVLPQDQPSERYLWQLVQITDSINTIQFGSEQGEYIGAGYTQDSRLVLKVADKSTNYNFHTYTTDSQGNRKQLLDSRPNYDPRIRPWYQEAAVKGKTVWSPIYVMFSHSRLGITLAEPVFGDKDKLLGVVGTDILLSEISKFLNTLRIGQTGQAFIIERSGLLVASSTSEQRFIQDGDKTQRLFATHSRDPLIQLTAQYLNQNVDTLNQINQSQQLSFNLNRDRYYLQVTPFQDNHGLDWLIVVAIPEADFMAQIHDHTRTTISLCFAAFVVATGLGIFTARRITQPITQLSIAAAKIAQGKFDQQVKVNSKIPVRVHELEILAQSFNQMSQQLYSFFTALEKNQAELESRVEQRTAALRLSEEKFALAFRSSPNPITITTLAEGTFIEVNESFLKITGYNLEDVIAHTSIELNFWVESQERTRIRSLLIKTGAIRDKEFQFYTKSGQVRTGLLSAELITIGEEECILAVINDITERKQAEQRVELLLTISQAINAAPDFQAALEIALHQVCQTTGWIYGEVWIPATDGMALECSHRWYYKQTELDPDVATALEQFREYSEALTFLPEEEIPGRVWCHGEPEWISDIATESDDVFLRLKLATDCGLKSAFAVPIVAPATPQTSAPVLAVLLFFMAEEHQNDENWIELVSVVSTQLGPVMQQKKAEAEMKALFAAMTDMVLVVDASGRCLKVAPTNKGKWCKSPGNILGTTLLEYFDSSQVDFILNSIREALLTQATVNIEYCINLAGEDIWFAANLSPLSDDSLIWVARDITDRKQAEVALRLEQEKSEQLLLNILPELIAERLKQDQSAIAENFDDVTILFADIVGFTPLSARLKPIELVNLLNQMFSTFDQLAERHGLEKIKTIGDAYMVVGGLPQPRGDHAEAIAQMALDMQQAITQFQAEHSESLQIRIGINTGSVVAGVIGIRKFIYDLWGDAVNVASRMESSGEPGKIQVTETTYQRLRDKFQFQERGAIAVKGRGEMTTYWLMGK